MSTIPAPGLKLSIANSILSISSAHAVLSFDLTASTHPQFLSASSSTPQLDKVKDAKSKAVKLIASGLVPKNKQDGQEQEWELVVASLTENKVLRMSSVDTGEVLYERTTSKKGACLSIESDGSLLLSDKIGDVYSYPYIDESSTPIDARPARTPIPVEATTDPTLNPDATLLAGHVSNHVVHAVLPRLTEGMKDGEHAGPWLATADRDEHVRISRYPEAFVIERYLFGHESFVSAIHCPLSSPSLLLTAGGDPSIHIFHHPTSTLLHRIPILETFRNHRVVRSAPRAVRGLLAKARKEAKVKQAREASEAGATEEEEQMSMMSQADVAPKQVKIKDLTDEEWAEAPDGYILPEGEGLCMGKIDSAGEWVIYFTEGSAALHTFRLPSSKAGGKAPEIFTYATGSPVLDFVVLAGPTPDSAPEVLVSTDPVWEHRVDGGKAFVQGSAGPEGSVGVQEKVNAFLTVQIAENGEISNISEQRQPLLDLLHDQAIRLPASDALSIPAYPNLSLLPRWPGMEDEDSGANPDATTESDIASLTENNRRKALGKLKAAGVPVAIPRTPEQKMRKHELNVQKKKRKLEEKRAARNAGEPLESSPLATSAVAANEDAGDDAMPGVEKGPMSMSKRELFGGAIEADIPAQFIDASDLRQVPDTQEVFLSPFDDTSVIFEILEVVTEGRAGADLWEAVKFHFESLAHDNSALSSSITTSPPTTTPAATQLPPYTSTDPSSLHYPHIPTPAPVLLSGRQTVRKFTSNKPLAEQAPPDEVHIVLALWRIVLPCADQLGTSRQADVVASVNVNLSEGQGAKAVDVEQVEGWFNEMSRSLKVMDYGLFVES